MGILVECPKCKARGSIARKVCKCGNQVQKSNSKNYWIDYYDGGKRKRERIGRSKKASENRLREIQTAKAEGRYLKKDKNASITLGQIRDWYLDLSETKQKRSMRLSLFRYRAKVAWTTTYLNYLWSSYPFYMV